jgi:hypothetical protein
LCYLLRPLPPVCDLLAAAEQPAPFERRHDPARGGRRTANSFGEVSDGQGLDPVRGVEGGQLGEAKVQLRKVRGKSHDQVTPEGTAHGNSIGKQARVLDLISRGGDRRTELLVARVTLHPCIIARK